MSRKKVVALAVAIAAVIAVTTVVVVRVTADGPDDVVRAYLEAARRGDVAAALKAAGVEHPPTGATAVLLTTPALDVAWDLGAISAPYNEYDGDAEVDATITDRSVTGKGYFTLHKSNGRWRITNPFATLRVARSAVRYAQINGRSVVLTADQQVLPGIYRQTAVTGPVRATNPQHVVAVPDSHTDRSAVLPQDFAPTTEAQQRFQQLSNAYLDKCLTDPTCTAHGTVVRYPTVNLPGTLTTATGGEVAFAGQVTVPGVLRVNGSTCLFDGIGYAMKAWVDSAGVLQADWFGQSPTVSCRSWD